MREIYQAFDGRIFSNEEDAAAWEEKYRSLRFYNFAHEPNQPLVILERNPEFYSFDNEDELDTDFRLILEDGELCNLIIVYNQMDADEILQYWEDKFSIDVPYPFYEGAGAYVRVYYNREWNWMKYEDYKRMFGTDQELDDKIEVLLNAGE